MNPNLYITQFFLLYIIIFLSNNCNNFIFFISAQKILASRYCFQPGIQGISFVLFVLLLAV